tara:strand:+ start:109 stop:564 length:456 start_codon:yes stop_codon:yes gene_type:complete
MNKCCNHCDVLLDNINWSIGNVRKNNYICRVCDSKKGKRNRLKRLALSIHQTALRQYNQVKAGHVYIISNPAWPEWVKVGMAIDAADRCSNYQTSSPFRDYVVEYSFASTNRRKDESLAHQKLAAISQDRRGEWFKLPVSKAIGCISGITK